MHHDVDASDRFSDHANFGEFGSGSSGDFGDPERSEFCLEVIELFGQLFLLLRTKLRALDLHLRKEWG